MCVFENKMNVIINMIYFFNDLSMEHDRFYCRLWKSVNWNNYRENAPRVPLPISVVSR